MAKEQAEGGPDRSLRPGVEGDREAPASRYWENQRSPDPAERAGRSVIDVQRIRLDDSTAHIDQNVATNLRHLRERRGLSQTGLAKMMDEAGFPWHQTTVSRVEAAERPVNLAEAYALAAILEVAVGALAGPPDDQKIADDLIASHRNADQAMRSLHDETMRLLMAQSDLLHTARVAVNAGFGLGDEEEESLIEWIDRILSMTPEDVVVDARQEYARKQAEDEHKIHSVDVPTRDGMTWTSPLFQNELERAVERARYGEMTVMNLGRLSKSDRSRLSALKSASISDIQMKFEQPFLVIYPSGTLDSFIYRILKSLSLDEPREGRIVLWMGPAQLAEGTSE